jgi:hypothetical protein
MSHEVSGVETADSTTVKRKRVRKKRQQRRRPSWRDRLRVVFSSNALFYVLLLAVVGVVVALFVAARDLGAEGMQWP